MIPKEYIRKVLQKKKDSKALDLNLQAGNFIFRPFTLLQQLSVADARSLKQQWQS